MPSYTMPCNSGLEDYFATYRRHIIGYRQSFLSPFGRKRIIYADWTASGRAYGPIEDTIRQQVLPFVGNTHTHTTVTGTYMSEAYETAKGIIKAHVNAAEEDVLLFCGSGMTGAVNKLQRLLGLRIPGRAATCLHSTYREEAGRPVVFVTHMEHHSHHISWLETMATVEIIARDANGQVDLRHFHALLEQYKQRTVKIAAVTAASNVTGIRTPYHDMAKLVHRYNGWCFVDFACAAPYCDIDMHPDEPGAALDAIYFSPHKLLGGPGTPGVLLFHQKLYCHAAPDEPGGGTVDYTNPWGEYDYTADIAQREDGGTPPFLQGIKAAMCIRLKEAMQVDNIRQREEALLSVILPRLARIPQLQVLEPQAVQRLGVVSFIVPGVHYHLVVRLLNDRFGIQLRGGCSCAGTYGHLLLNVDKERSHAIRQSILSGDMSCKPGWVRLSVHPTMTDREVHYILDAIEATVLQARTWGRDYVYDARTNDFRFQGAANTTPVDSWFNVDGWHLP
ncbi:Selenocysteine lyase/Cysteine desulfurase [Chitinophaga eiseniae]|uniref:Selenocysteine lyase/Cysteine desulfurase n=1 Tax=Chitinophaga eiseniae TaxID=634771 RepID=A0A1T4NBG0_9BACT|nr:aminotransferase class V-fold PLP-dependent enzyme [Chitinophaga eiseniae]SJZ76609.1 Selenocysteine lyase/Cysteine desulfurase [Chitinophaga eiseniae]